MKRKQSSHVGLGAASLIMILLVLCLALMGVLSLMSARADLSMSRRYAELAEGYARASSQAQRAIAHLDERLEELRLNAQDEAQYADACMQIAQLGDVHVEWKHAHEAKMRFDAGAERELEVTIERTAWDKAQNHRCQIVSYRLMDVKEWNQTESLILMDM